MIIFKSSTWYKFNIRIITSTKKSTSWTVVVLVDNIDRFIHKFKKLVNSLIAKKSSICLYSKVNIFEPRFRHSLLEVSYWKFFSNSIDKSINYLV